MMGKRGRPPAQVDYIKDKLRKIGTLNGTSVKSIAHVVGTESAWASVPALEKAGKELRAENVETVYGMLKQTLDLEIGPGKVFAATFVVPHALLRYMTSSSTPAARFCEMHLQRGSKIFFHVDEARIGNALRPDAGRSFQSITWFIGSFPSWCWVLRRCKLMFAV